MTSKLLLEAGYTAFRYNPLFGFPPPDGITNLIPVTEQSNAFINGTSGARWAPVANYRYRGVEQWGWAVGKTDGWQASASYVTGAQSIKVGYQGNRLDQLDQTLTDADNMSYRFNQGVPNAVTYWLPDFGHRTLTNLHGVYAQDSWTYNRLTLQGALRWDRASSYSPVEGNGTTRLSQFNTQPYAFPVVPGVAAYNDLTPRVGVAYDVFGTGKTAVKFNWGKYLAYGANDAPYTSSNPAVTIQSSVTNRGWIDNGNKIVDCDLNNPAANTRNGDTCAAVTGNSINFGKANTTTIVDPKMLSGWGVRPGDTQATILLQQEIIPRLSGEFSYTHRSFHGFFVTDDLNRNAATAYETYTLTAPVDPRLPGGGGYPITSYIVTAAAGPTAAKTYQTVETDFGPERDSHWDGFDVTFNARLRSGLVASIGTSTGRAIVDTCATATKYNQVSVGLVTAELGPDPRGCRNIDPFQTTVRGLASYTIPKVDVLVSATVRSQPALPLTATWQVPNSVINAALGHAGFGLIANGTTNINLIDNSNKLFADNRRTQIDMRFAKVLRFGRTRSDIGIDLFNLLNTNYATAYNGTYVFSSDNTPRPAGWATPTGIYAPRFVRINYTIDF
jgi:hypothetical protein